MVKDFPNQFESMQSQLFRSTGKKLGGNANKRKASHVKIGKWKQRQVTSHRILNMLYVTPPTSNHLSRRTSWPHCQGCEYPQTQSQVGDPTHHGDFLPESILWVEQLCLPLISHKCTSTHNDYTVAMQILQNWKIIKHRQLYYTTYAYYKLKIPKVKHNYAYHAMILPKCTIWRHLTWGTVQR